MNRETIADWTKRAAAAPLPGSRRRQTRNPHRRRCRHRSAAPQAWGARRRRRARALVACGALAVTLLIAGCGQAGEPGKSYLALDWVYTPEALSFPAFPSTVTAGEYIRHSAGSYRGEYIAWDGSYWSADYRIEVSPGEPGGLLLDGADGADMYFTMWLYSFGPSLYQDQSVAEAALAPAAALPARHSRVTQASGPGGDPLRSLKPAAQHTETRRKGRVTVTVTFTRYEPAEER